jgi:hypothetical protein
MTAEELEELLAPKKQSNTDPSSSSTATFARLNLNDLTALGTTLNGYTSHSGRMSQAYNERSLSTGDISMINNAILEFINESSRGLRYDSNELQGLSRRVASFTETYMYRWFPYLIHPKIECKVGMAQELRAAELAIIINDLRIGTIGVRTR